MSDELPEYDHSKPIKSIMEMRPDGCMVVALMDGTFAKVTPGETKPSDPAACTPQHLVQWVVSIRGKGNYPRRYLDFLAMLADDRRMADFWAWLGDVKFKRVPSLKNSITIGRAIWQGTRLPGKPGNMTPAQRDAYFKKVRHHADALSELLAETRFDRDWKSELDDKDLEKPLGDALYQRGDDESDDGHVVAYLVTPDARYQFHYNYPDSALTETLGNLVGWTYWDDQWDDNIFASSAPIVQANSESARVVYFTCSVHDWFAGYGVEVPFPILATAANVALGLDADDQVDEETVRKQVRRHQARQAKQRTERPGDDAGQDFEF